MDDWNLLQAYAQNGSESAFQQLVERYVAQVHSMALRQVRDPHLAQDVTQAVFLIMVRKAASLPRKTLFAGWLFQATRHVARTALRGERRRKQRELQAMASTPMNPESEASEQVEAHLDDALASLRESDRNALLLRYFQQRTVPDVAASLGTSEEAAQKRIERAVKRLRRYFGRCGVAVPAVTLMSVVSAQAVQPAPPLVTHGIVALSVPSAPAVSAMAVTLMQGALKRMLLSKLWAPATVGMATLLVGLPILGFLVFRGPNAPQDYDLSRDFSLASNPNGAWSFGWQTTPGGTFNILPVRGTTSADNGVPLDYWQAVSMNEPTIYHNGTTVTATAERGNVDLPPGTVWYSAGPQGSGRDFAVIRFTAPRTATYLVTMIARPYGDAAWQGDTELRILRNGVELFARNLAPGDGATHTNTMALSTGEAIDFAIGRGPDDSNYASTLKMTIRVSVQTRKASGLQAGALNSEPPCFQRAPDAASSPYSTWKCRTTRRSIWLR